MYRPLPRTHFDFWEARHPQLTQALDAKILEQGFLSKEHWPMNMDELAASSFKPLFDHEMERLEEGVWNKNSEHFGHLGVSKQEFQRLAEKELQAPRAFMNFVYTHVVNFISYGRKTFFIGDGLLSRLAETELNVPAEVVTAPFRSCMLVYDSAAAWEAFHAIGDSQEPAHAPISVYLHLRPHPLGRLLVIYACQEDMNKSYASVSRELLLADGSRLEDVLRTEWTKLGVSNGTEEDDSRFYGPGLRFFRIVLNTLLYMTSGGAEIGLEIQADHRLPKLTLGMTTKEKRKLAERKMRSSALIYVEVGKSVPNLGISGVGSALAVRQLVRGHWKRQPVGPGGQERKLILVEPYWRGPEMAEVIEKPYLVR